MHAPDATAKAPAVGDVRNVSAEALRREVLDPVLDAQAANDQQRNLTANFATREIDSLAEVFAAMRRIAAGDEMSRLIAQGERLTREITSVNAVERSCERQVAGWADRTANTLHQSGERVTAGRALGEALVRKLDSIDLDRPLESVGAIHDIYSLFERLGSGDIFSTTVLYVIGKRRERVLRDLREQWEQV